MISRRALFSTSIGLLFGVKAALGAPVTKRLPKYDNRKIEDLTGLLLDKFFTHIVYSKFPRHCGPTVGADILFAQKVIPYWKMKWDLPFLVCDYGDFWYQGVNDCLARAGIKAINTMMVTARRMTNDDILITYHVIQSRNLPKPTEDEIGRAVAMGY